MEQITHRNAGRWHERRAVPLTVSLVIAVIAGVLTLLAHREMFEAILTTGSAFAGTAQLIRELTRPGGDRDTPLREE